MEELLFPSILAKFILKIFSIIDLSSKFQENFLIVSDILLNL